MADQVSAEQQAKALESQITKSLLLSFSSLVLKEVKNLLVKFSITQMVSDVYFEDELQPSGVLANIVGDFNSKFKPIIDGESKIEGMEVVEGFELEAKYDEGTLRIEVYGTKNGTDHSFIISPVKIMEYPV